MLSPISLGPDFRRMTYHQPVLAGRSARRRFVRYGASVSIFAITLGASGSLNTPQGFSAALAAAPEDAFPFSDMTPMSEAALEDARGGFSVGNVNVNIGVTVETQIDGFVTVTTNFNVTMPGMLENMGTEITSVAEAASQAANAAVDAANAAINAANAATAAATAEAATAWQNPDSTATPAPAQPAATAPANVAIGDIATATPTVNGTTPAVPAVLPPAPLTDNPTVVKAIETLNEGVRPVLGETLTEYVPPAATPPATTPPPIVSVVANQADSTRNNGTGAVAVSGLAKDGGKLVIPSITGNAAQVIHDTTSGHTTIISNTMNNVTIRQNISMNMTVDNFTNLQNISSLNRVVGSLSRQIGMMGLTR